MKTPFAPTAARVLAATLFLISSLCLCLLALNLSTPATAATHKNSSRHKARLARAAVSIPNVIPPAPADSGPRLGFENFEGPGVLTQVTSTSQGSNPHTVEYIAHDAGEPSIGVNWNTNVTAFQSDLQTLFVTFNDQCTSAPKATWVNRQAPTSQVADQDPIGFVDKITGRTFSAQLTLTTPTCKTSYTDDDGLTWVPTQGFGIASGIDHQTIGGGPYHAILPVMPPTPYPHAFYYCSQLPAAGCARSDDGGETFGPVVEIDPPADAHCVGIHGHVKVGPDGTVYVPTCNCDGQGSVIVSENNGITWTIRHVPGTNPTLDLNDGNIIDAQVGVDDANNLYFAMANAPAGFANGSNPVVAVSPDHGANWTHVFDVGASFGIHNIEFPYVVAGDANRAAVAFLGSTTGGDPSANGFKGDWHLYVAATFDGGAHWSTSDATPNDILQRGCIWNKGGANICRNLLDFIGATVDKQGRIEVGYVDGCAEGTCDQAVSSTTRFIGNGYTARGSIARQSSGRRMIASFDPASPTSVPGMPFVNARRVNGVVHLAWSLADSGNLMINSYKILRGTASGGETPLTTLSGTQTGGAYDDTLASNDTATYYYKVVAVNSAGESCANNELAVPWVGDTCSGLVLQRNPASHEEQTTQGQTPPSLAIDYIAVAEPPGTSDLKFIMKVTNLDMVPPNCRWRLVWNWQGATGQQYYVGMRTNGSSTKTFEFGHVATAVVGLVLGVPTETKEGDAVGTATADGLITITVPKAAVGNPQLGDLLGSVNGRTFGPDNMETQNLERSNLLLDHTFAKGQRDNGHPAATYMISGNNACGSTGLAPVFAVSRKTHGTAGNFDVDLLLPGGKLGVEDRSGGPAGNFKMVISFAKPVTLNGMPKADVTTGNGNVANTTVNGSVVTLDLTGVTNAQAITVTLFGVNDGTTNANVAIPMGVLAADTTADHTVNSADISQTKSQSGVAVSNANFREDLNEDGSVNSADITLAKSQSGMGFP